MTKLKVIILLFSSVFRQNCTNSVDQDDLSNQGLHFLSIMQTYTYDLDPCKPHFYIVKLGFTGVYIIFLIFALKHTLLVLVRTDVRRF